MRIVRERVVLVGAGRLRSGEPVAEIKDYFDRVAKYIPAEVVAAYISANGVATLARDPSILYGIIFVVCVICTPLYITRFTSTRREAWTNGVMAISAFLVWAYATDGGLVKYLGWYEAPIASVILVLFTLFSGAVIPLVRQEPPKAQVIPSPPSESAK